jgi:hypothetical protein
LQAAAKKQPPPAAKSKKPAGEKPEESVSAKAGAAHGHGHGHRHGHGKGHGHPRQGDKHAHDAAPASAEVWLFVALFYGCLWPYSCGKVRIAASQRGCFSRAAGSIPIKTLTELNASFCRLHLPLLRRLATRRRVPRPRLRLMLRLRRQLRLPRPPRQPLPRASRGAGR